MADDLSELAGSLMVEQIILRALLREVARQFIRQSSDSSQAAREFGEGLQKFVNGCSVQGTDDHEMELAKERARLNIDALMASFSNIGENS